MAMIAMRHTTTIDSGARWVARLFSVMAMLVSLLIRAGLTRAESTCLAICLANPLRTPLRGTGRGIASATKRVSQDYEKEWQIFSTDMRNQM